MNNNVTTSAQELRYTILALQRQGNRHLAGILRTIELTPPQAEAMEILDSYGPMTTQDVGRHMLCESGSPSRILAALARKGLTIRSRPEEDKRATLHSLTQAGQAKMQDIHAVEAEFTNRFLDSLMTHFDSIDEVEPTIRILTKLVSDPALREALRLRFPHLKNV
ncbi:MarR family winged helix-turn-helix transcriptional regulator [Corynebacterium kroppenstedtii]|uniref:MarR family winged helix-turn-helix transcriptional regulator n=1 Tax=Corynebacterium sp. PCR 32 TaxID=3351342 RepID=UPI0030ADEE6B